MYSARKFLAVTLGGAALSLLAVVPAQAGPLNAVRTGWIQSNGQSAATGGPNQNYLTGLSGGIEYRSFFVFDLTGISSMITGATLQLYNPKLNPNSGNGFSSIDATEIFTLSSTSVSPVNFPNNYGFGSLIGQGIFGTLGTGTSFGTLSISSVNNGSTLNLSFNSIGLSYLNANLGSKVAFGGRVSTISGGGNQNVFGFTDPSRQNGLNDTPPVILDVQTASNLTPESDGIWLFLPALLPVAFLMYKRRRSLQSV